MIHVIPFEGYQNHGFYNYQPSCFMDLALANNYEVIGFYYNVAFKIKFNKYIGNTNVIPYTDGLMDELRVQANKGRLPSTPMGNDSILSVILRKQNNEPFQIPFDGKFSQQSKLDGTGDFAHRSNTSSINEYFLGRKNFEFFDQKFNHADNIRQSMKHGLLVIRLRGVLESFKSWNTFVIKFKNQVKKFK